MAKTSDYWKKRMEALEDEQYQRSAAYYTDVQKQFQNASQSIQGDIERWYQRLADNNGISYSDAKKLLSKSELKEFHWSVEQYIKAGEENALDQRWMKELENASARHHIDYLTAIKLQTQQYAELLSTEFEGDMTDFLHKSYSEQYYRSAWEIAHGTGTGGNLARIDTRKIDTIVKRPWAQDGKNFSDRIWTNKEKLVRNLHTELTQNIIRGEAPRKAIDRLAKAMNVSQSQAGNLIMTESAAIASAAQMECFKALGVEQYQFDATLDGNTCDVCGGMDQLVFKMSEYQVGVTAPPIHPRCRCCTTPYYDDWEEFGISSQRAARDPETGKTVYVDGSMKYEDWMDNHVKGGILEETTDKWPEEARNELLQDEMSLASRPKETAVIYGADGSFLFQKRGEVNEVNFSYSEVKRMRGGVVSHNHPNGSSFSVSDILLLKESKASEIRAITEGGTYFMRRPVKWPAEINSYEKIKKEKDNITSALKDKYQKLYKEGKISKEGRNQMVSNESVAEFAKKYHIEYGREEFVDE